MVIYVYIYICTYITSIWICIYVYIYFIYIHIYLYTFIYIYVCIHVYPHILTFWVKSFGVDGFCVYFSDHSQSTFGNPVYFWNCCFKTCCNNNSIYIYKYVCMHIADIYNMNACVWGHVSTCVFAYIWIYMYIYMNIYVHIHTEEMIEYTHKCCAGDQWMCHDLYNLISHMTHIYVCVYDSIILFWVCDIYPFGIRKPKRIRFRWYVRCIRCEYQKDIWHMNMWCKFVFTSQNVWDDTWNVWEDTLWYVTNLYEMMQFVTHSVSDMSRTRMIHEMYAMIQGRHIHSSRIVEYENVSLARDTSDDECVTNCIHTDECVTNCIHTHTYSWWHIRQWMCHELIRDQWMCHDLYHLIRVRGISDNECATNCSI